MEFPLLITWFINIRFLDVVDILLVAFFIYQLYQLIRGTTALSIFFGILSMYILYLLVDALEMRLLSQILGQFIGVGVLALIIVFQQEIRRFLLYIGSTSLRKRLRFLKKIFPGRFDSLAGRHSVNMTEISQALEELTRTKTGAILVIIRESELKIYQRSGVEIDGKLTSQLVVNLFYKNNPLHDGAILIKGNRILAARCILPISEKADFPDTLGLRHRAAAGITEVSDAVAIITSEQTGTASICYHGKLELELSTPEIIKRLEKIMREV